MRRLFEALAADGRQRDFLVWSGVGDGSFLGAARMLGARHALFIEPHRGLRERLLERYVLADSELLSDRPLWRATGSAVFHVTNDAASSSLVPPAQRQGARRNIRVVEERPVEADSLESALAPLPAEGRAGLLVLDAGGAEPFILEGASADALARFDTIVVPARERERIGARLGERGFDAARAVHDENGNEWAVFVVGNASETPQVENLRSELAQRQAEVDALHAQLEALTTAFEAAQAAHAEAESGSQAGHAKVVEALQAEQARVLEALQAEHAAQVAELEARIVSLAAERDAASAALSERSGEAEILRAKLASAGEEAAQAATELAAERDVQAAHALDLQQKLTEFSTEAEQTIAALTRERDSANGALAEATAAVARLQPALEQEQARAGELESRVSGLEQQLVEARQVSTLSVKLQAQRDADLADLQERYRESQAVQARQRELLEKLGARLSVASHYFHQLADGRSQGGGNDDGATDAALQSDFDGVPR